MDKFVIFDMDFTLINSFTLGPRKWMKESQYYYVPRPEYISCDDGEIVWIRPGIEQVLQQLKDSGYKLLYWTSRQEVHARPVIKNLPFNHLFDAFYFGDQGITTEHRLKSIHQLRNKFYPNHKVSQFFLVDDDKDNININPYNAFEILRFTEWGFKEKEHYDNHIKKSNESLKELCKKIDEHFNR